MHCPLCLMETVPNKHIVRRVGAPNFECKRSSWPGSRRVPRMPATAGESSIRAVFGARCREAVFIGRIIAEAHGPVDAMAFGPQPDRVSPALPGFSRGHPDLGLPVGGPARPGSASGPDRARSSRSAAISPSSMVQRWAPVWTGTRRRRPRGPGARPTSLPSSLSAGDSWAEVAARHVVIISPSAH